MPIDSSLILLGCTRSELSTERSSFHVHAYERAQRGSMRDTMQCNPAHLADPCRMPVQAQQDTSRRLERDVQAVEDRATEVAATKDAANRAAWAANAECVLPHRLCCACSALGHGGCSCHSQLIHHRNCMQKLEQSACRKGGRKGGRAAAGSSRPGGVGGFRGSCSGGRGGGDGGS